jgi:crotonobetainyl-CoA:carnitine CoA-transferase CaiB-like acyl-CoA transferase
MGTPLQGLLVVALEQAVAAPFCTQRLVEAGARVIKIERAEGDFARRYESSVLGESGYFVWLNRDKESIVLDLKDQPDRDLLDRMIRKADVFVQSLAPGAARRYGLGPDGLRERNPTLITCDISGYGSSGPLSEAKAYDLLIQAESGLASVTGRPEGPGRVGVSVCDIAAGMYAYAGILQALFERTRTGKGTHVSASLFKSMTDWMTVPLLHYAHGGAVPQRLGLRHPSIAPYGAYSTTDGEVMLAVQNEREWKRLCDVVLNDEGLSSDPRFASNENRVTNRDALDVEINLRLNAISKQDALELLSKADIASASVNTVEDVWNHPQLRLGRATTPGGEVTMPVSALSEATEGPAADLGRVPRLDESGPSIRKEFA